MAYIYKITNKVNNKIYIGKTEFSIEKRFKEHCNDAFKERNEKRPLYLAMKKYGINNFSIELIEETLNPEEREKFWIEKTGAFKYGYNATIGGDGKRYLDYDLIIATYQEVQNIAEVARILNISRDSVHDILEEKNIDIKLNKEVLKEKLSKTTGMYKDNILIKIFTSTAEAAKFLIQEQKTASNNITGISSHIAKVCKEQRKSAYGFQWKYL